MSHFLCIWSLKITILRMIVNMKKDQVQKLQKIIDQIVAFNKNTLKLLVWLLSLYLLSIKD